ncbi:hypothetical protein ACFVTZ_03630 [Cellulosimicrobium cellulans]|uniref:hypothetical protein n=1 Tax=Cellulosimicrobium cellulans TaxID=1710 RepID=UPI0036E49EA3
MYWQHFVDRGRPADRRRNLQDLLRLTLASVEIVATRREALDSVAESNALPTALAAYRHSVYETSVVYEFSQLARQDFEAHGNTPVWERPIAWQVPNGKYWRSGHIDMALFSKTRNIETRIEFGKSDPRLSSRPHPRDLKLEDDGRKLFETRLEHRTSKNEALNEAGTTPSIENFVVIWEERDSRTQKSTAKLTHGRGQDWLERCRHHAAAAAIKTGCSVVLEAVAASSLVSFDPAIHRSAFAAIYSIALTD